ncbi:MAG TPA: multiheme c-type cytochrome [Polyangiaceae bacterium]|nr:multiheme c-type cytochrome [Polyangiaceae bacterium]
MSSVAGALEPCGCVKDMQGGADHAAAFIASQATAAPSSLVLGAGPMLFMSTRRDAARDIQAGFKADALADAYRALKLSAWAPGANDWLLGEASLNQLAQRTGATLLAANLKGGSAQASKLLEISGIKVGLAGVSMPLVAGKGPEGLTAAPAAPAAAEALAALGKAGSQLDILLAAMPRGEALRLIEAQPGFEVVVLGKPFDEGEANDPPMSPLMIGKTLVVETPNHLQSLAVVDLYVRGQAFDFADGSGLESTERKLEIGRRLREIQTRLEQGGDPKDLSALQKDKRALESELKQLPEAKPPAQGSFFRFQAVEVKEKLGTDKIVAGHIATYYQRVNDHNRQAFKDLKPAAPAEGQPSFVGVEGCTSCHQEERKFWDSTAHAGAYATLSTQHKEFNLDCVGCHVTGYSKPGGSTVTHVAKLKDVQCEVCHGPGSQHVASPQDKAYFKKPSESACATECHHPPHVHPGWSTEAAWSKIIGPGHGMPGGG